MITASYPFEHKWQRNCKVLLALFWITGLLFGVTAAVSGRETILLLMHQFLYEQMSIVGLLLRCSFSFLITVLAVILSNPGLFLPAALLESFLLAFLMESAVICWPVTGGIVILLLFACPLLSACSLLWFWFRHISGFRSTILRDIFSCFLFHCVMGYVEIWYYGKVFDF